MRAWRALTAILMVVLAATPAAAKDAVITIGDDYFDEKIQRVPVGSTVIWESIALLKHTVTADDGSFFSKDLRRGSSFGHRFDKSGVYRYFCRYHGAPGGAGMTGIILVGDAKASPAPAKLPGDRPLTLRVPDDHRTIQEAVDAARPRDLVLISPGIYREDVVVRTSDLTIRGVDRHNVVLDGEFVRPNGFLVAADGVAIENLTARNYIVNGFYWAHVRGYRGSYISAIRNGDYGIYAIQSRGGTLDHVYTAGSPDGGIYIGACLPCDAIVTHSLSEFNELGFSGTNAGGNLFIVNSEWRNNRTGILPNTLDSERFAPQRGVVIKNNWVHDNGDPRAPYKDFHYPVFDAGIGLVGTRDDVVTDNIVTSNKTYGILVMPVFDLRVWTSGGNTVESNEVSGSGRADLALTAPSMGKDCFDGNTFKTSLPVAIELRHGCGSWMATFGGGDFPALAERLARAVVGTSGDLAPVSYKTAPSPGATLQPDMPNAVGDEPVPSARSEPTQRSRDLATERVTFDAAAAQEDKEAHMLGIGASPGPLALFFGIYLSALPFALYGAWMALALWDLAHREDLGSGKRIGWGTFVLAVPFVGPATYLLGGGATIKRSFGLFIVIGGLFIFALLAALSLLGMA